MNTEKIIKLPQLGRFLADLKAWLSSTYAKINGYYSTLVAGAAENLVGRGSVLGTFFFRTTAGTASVGSGSAEIKAVRGKGLVWNQLQPIKASSITETQNGVTLTDNRDGSYTLNGTATTDTQFFGLYQTTAPKIIGHKYLCKGCYSLNPTYPYGVAALWFSEGINAINAIVTITSAEQQSLYFYWNVRSGSVCNNIVVRPQIFDLTLMFGAGNEPSTVAEFEALYNAPYYPYNAGEIRSLKASGIKTTGFNQWDEEWTQGLLNDADGTLNPSFGQAISFANFNACFPNTTYYGYIDDANNSRYLEGYFYDSNKHYLGVSKKATVKNRTFTTPPNACFFKLRLYDNIATITPQQAPKTCINISHSGIRNGDYEAYWDATLALPITTATGKLNGQGTSVTIFPNGMMSAGNTYDELQKNKAIKRIGVVDLGSLDWTYDSLGRFVANFVGMAATEFVPTILNTYGYYGSASALGNNPVNNALAYYNNKIYLYNTTYTDAASFKTAMSGVMLYYELATPEEYTLDTELTTLYRDDDFGTEEAVIPANTESAPLVIDVKYPMNAVDTLRNLPKDYVGAAPSGTASSLGNMLEALKTAGVISAYTISWDSTNQRYNFSITRSE